MKTKKDPPKVTLKEYYKFRQDLATALLQVSTQEYDHLKLFAHRSLCIKAIQDKMSMSKVITLLKECQTIYLANKPIEIIKKPISKTKKTIKDQNNEKSGKQKPKGRKIKNSR